ncbi:hypothetical protein Ga0609869_003013 [Rhodovulum iodosum]|uniref:Uncharacterized protein n=1 Tax=Rhodovulum iodosum TaxID=68291 RepID=A0ABV3XWF4_9RHOB|nr:hypothetical protein [Rhodovulum robiginosum]RSK36790.1 hypothetical protein EJA01_04655 [Rhodovulum robiginosum]
MRLAPLFVALCLAAPAAAQPVSLGTYQAVQTRFGTLTVGPVSQWEQGLYLNGGGVPLAAEWRVTIRGAFARQGDDHDWVLVETSHNGNMCPVSYVVLRLSADALRRTAPFGSCLGRIDGVRLAPGRFEIDLADPDIRVDLQRFAFDGARLTVAAIAPGAGPSDPAGPGGDVTRWLADHASALFNDPAEQARFAAIMPIAAFEELRQRTAVAGRAEQRGGWVFGAGCMAHQCNARAGFWGLRIADGTPVAAFLDRGAAPRWFGDRAALSDPSVAAFLAERSLR